MSIHWIRYANSTKLFLLQLFVFCLCSTIGPVSSAQTNSDPKVVLNHLYVVLDQTTYDRVLGSAFLNEEFAAIDSGMPEFNRPDGSTRSIYLRGQKTYLELLSPNNVFKEPVGKVGFGFSVEKTDRLGEVEKRLRAKKLEVGRIAQRWTKGAPNAVDWFQAVIAKASPDSPFVWWVSEFSPDFLKELYPKKFDLHGKVDRQSFLNPLYSDAKIFKDVESVTLKLPNVERQHFARGMRAMGFDQKSEDNCLRLTGPDLTIILENGKDSDVDSSVLKSVGFSTNRMKDNQIAEMVHPRFAVHVNGESGSISFANTNLVKRHRDAVRRTNCFPIEKLPDDLQVLSRHLLLKAMDSEALYTFVGDLKPVSEGFYQSYIMVKNPNVEELKNLQRAVSVWGCGNCYEAGILPFNRHYQGKRFVSVWVANRKCLNRKIEQKQEFFGQLGLTDRSTAQTALLMVERSSSMEDRWRGFGNLFGYPDSAIDFFVRAGVHHATTGEFVERDFRNFPTHARSVGGFVYAVPKLSLETESEKAVRRTVESVLTTYRSLRDQRIENDNPDQIVELLRDWFDDGSGWCHPSHASQKAAYWAESRKWVESNAIQLKSTDQYSEFDDLRQLDFLFAKPRIIALGDPAHGTREFLQFKHRVFRHLVENHGVRLIGIESSFATCLSIDEYIKSGTGNPKELIKAQGNWAWNTEEVLELVEWMRQWNADPKNRSDKLSFYGFDTRDFHTPLTTALAELEKTNANSANVYRNKLSKLLTTRSENSNVVSSQDMKQFLNAVDDLRNDIQKSSDKRSAEEKTVLDLAIFQAKSAIRQKLSEENNQSQIGSNLREETMAALVKKILDSHGSSSRMMLFAHNRHISKRPPERLRNTIRMGALLKKWFRKDYLPVALSFGSGICQAKYLPKPEEDSSKKILREFKVKGSRHDSFSQLFDRVKSSAFALDLLPNSNRQLPFWLKQAQFNRSIGNVFHHSETKTDANYEQLILPQHFELIVHVSKTTGAKLLGPIPKVYFGTTFANNSPIVLSVEKNSLAERCGILAGDKIVRFGDKEISSSKDFLWELSKLKRGGTVKIDVLRQLKRNGSRKYTLFILIPAWVSNQ